MATCLLSRKQRKDYCKYPASKCLHQLKPFDVKFDPFIHNEFLASRKKIKFENCVNTEDTDDTDDTDDSVNEIKGYQENREKTKRTLKVLSLKQICFQLFFIGNIFDFLRSY